MLSFRLFSGFIVSQKEMRNVLIGHHCNHGGWDDPQQTRFQALVESCGTFKAIGTNENT